MSQSTKQVRVVEQATPTPGQDFESTAFFDADGNPIDIGGGGGEAATWDTLADKPAVIAAGADAAAARAAIGAGTSSLVIGTSASTAKAGNAVQTATQTTATAIAPGTATNVQAILAELAARITALEGA